MRSLIVGTPQMPPDKLNRALDIAQQKINILTEQNVKQSLPELTPHGSSAVYLFVGQP